MRTIVIEPPKATAEGAAKLSVVAVLVIVPTAVPLKEPVTLDNVKPDGKVIMTFAPAGISAPAVFGTVADKVKSDLLPEQSLETVTEFHVPVKSVALNVPGEKLNAVTKLPRKKTFRSEREFINAGR